MAGGMTYGDGDFNYDGSVDFNDMVLLAQRYNTALAAPPVAAPVFSASRIKPPDLAPRRPAAIRPARRELRGG
jgi:hypothetical protein